MKSIWGVAAALVFCGCSLLGPRYANLTTNDLAPEIARWEEATKDPRRAAEAHLRLAVLYSHPAQPNPDYLRAAAALEGYAALDPKGAQDFEVRRWLGVLRSLQEARTGNRKALDKALEETSALKAENRELKKNVSEARRESQEAKEALAAQAKEKRELQETIERLKELDLQMDRMRKAR